MRNILFRCWIPGSNGESGHYTAFDRKGVFLAWGIDSGTTKAIVELPSGCVAMLHMGDFRFIDNSLAK